MELLRLKLELLVLMVNCQGCSNGILLIFLMRLLCRIQDVKLAIADLDMFHVMQRSVANPRGQSTSFRRSQLAQKATGAKLRMAIQLMMGRLSQQDGVVAW